MEPIDIDKIIKDKLRESNESHIHEMESAKPFIWSAVQNQLGRKNSLTWYHLAAAVLLLMISFSFILYGVQKEHKSELELLSGKIDQLQKNYQSQAVQLGTKDSQVELLGSELKKVELQLADLHQEEPIQPKETIIYRTDTIYLKQVEYITEVSDPVESKDIASGININQSDQMGLALVQKEETDDAIFPTYSSQQVSREASESIKLKFGSFGLRKN